MAEKKEQKNLWDKLTFPINRVLRVEAMGGIMLLIFTALALGWANSPWHESYHHFWEAKISFGVGSWALSKTLHHWINDGLMAIFFFVVGLEIKREVLIGELSSWRKASLPIFAAVGGMATPATIFLLLNFGNPGQEGWGVPMATDIAFSLGVLNLLGKRVPTSLKVFLTAFAVADDMGAVLVITFFYTTSLAATYLYIAAGLFALLYFFTKTGLRNLTVYFVVGLVIWYLFLKSGVHPTVAGVLLAFFIPARPKTSFKHLANNLKYDLRRLRDAPGGQEWALTHDQLSAFDRVKQTVERVTSPVQKLEHNLRNLVAFFIMPVFALANAGVSFLEYGINEAFSSISLSIAVALLAGNAIGITGFSFATVKAGIASLPRGIRWAQIFGASLLGGIGFTMSLFIANLAFDDPTRLAEAKIGILMGSFVSGIIGFFMVRTTLRFRPEEELEEEREAMKAEKKYKEQLKEQRVAEVLDQEDTSAEGASG